MKKAGIFDLDGTLIDAYDSIWASINFTRESLGYQPVNFQEVKKSVGGGDEVLMEKFFKPEDREKALQIYRNSQKEEIKKGNVKLLKGAEELLLFLKEKGVKLAVATNRNKFSVNLLSEKLPIFKYFALVLTADDVKEKKPNPEILNKICEHLKVEKRECFYVGDMDIDLKTGLNASIDTYIVLTGSSKLEDILRVKSNVNVFKDLFELKKFLKQLICAGK